MLGFMIVFVGFTSLDGLVALEAEPACADNTELSTAQFDQQGALQNAAADYNNENLAANYGRLDFDQTSSSGDAASNQLHDKSLEMLDVAGKVVLEIGCAGGEALIKLLDRGASQLIGVDQNELFIDSARKKFAGSDGLVRFIAGDMHWLPLADQSVDIIISRYALHYSTSVRTLVKELSRILRPGGQFIGVFNVVEMKSPSLYLERPVSSERWYPLFIDFGDRQFTAQNCASSSQEWLDALSACGFEVSFSQQLNVSEKWNNDKVQYQHHELADLFIQTMHANLNVPEGVDHRRLEAWEELELQGQANLLQLELNIVTQPIIGNIAEKTKPELDDSTVAVDGTHDMWTRCAYFR